MDEDELILSAKQGDLDAYNQIVLVHQDAAYGYAYSIFQDRQAAEDCIQDAFLKAYLHLNDFRGGSFRTYILRIVRNTCYDELRRSKRHLILPSAFQNRYEETVERLDLLADPGMSVEEQVEQRELRSLLFHHLDTLPDKYRTVLIMVDFLNLDYAEASSVLNVPLGTVKSRLARGRLFLSTSLQRSKDLLPRSELKSTMEGTILL